MKLGIVIPCYNEEAVLDETKKHIETLLNSMIEDNSISKDSFVCFVDDGSRDRSWEIIEEFAKDSSMFKGIKLSRNFGHQNALIAGLMQLKDSVNIINPIIVIILRGTIEKDAIPSSAKNSILLNGYLLSPANLSPLV